MQMKIIGLIINELLSKSLVGVRNLRRSIKTIPTSIIINNEDI